jgi:beta-glucanase (GH16 family)
MKKNYSLLLVVLLISVLTFGQQMPIDFSDSNDNFTPFGSASFGVRPDPQDATNQVGELGNTGADANQGAFLDLDREIDLDFGQTINLRFFSFDPNAHTVRIKLEQGANPDIEVTLNVPSPAAQEWKDLTFDFANAVLSSDGTTAVNGTGTYNRITIFVDAGVTTAGTYLLDDFDDGSTPTDPHELDVIYTDLVWADEFDVDGPVNSDNWHHQTLGPNGGQWFNGELQHYTDSQTNSFISGGFLNIVAKRETTTQDGVTLDFTSARLNSKFAFTYGRVDVRARLPFGEGTWPAIWTLGKNVNEVGAWFQTQGFGTTSWPACGEIDIMEHGLHATNEVSSAIHTPSSSGATVNTDTQMLADVANDFHVYSVNWSPNRITFMIDGVGYYTYEPDVYNADTWPFDLDQFLLLNVAMGGFAGNVDAGFSESAMIIDYVRVYQNENLSTDDVFASKFSVYPNPSDESKILNIKTTESIDKVELYNMIGQRILNQTNNTKEFNIQNVRTGVYLMMIYSGNKSITKRVIIK